MNIYLAGAMMGFANFNGAAFDHWAEVLRRKGHQVFSPHENSIKLFGSAVALNPDGDERRIARGDPLALSRMLFQFDLSWICLWADAVALLPGWQDSKGASAEAAVARALPIPVKPVEEF